MYFFKCELPFFSAENFTSGRVVVHVAEAGCQNPIRIKAANEERIRLTQFFQGGIADVNCGFRSVFHNEC